MTQSPQWLRTLERKLSWIAIPNIAILLVTLQALGFLMVAYQPIWVERLALIPSYVLTGEYWRLITFLALPLSLSPFWVIFVLWFIYFILNAIESEWGAFKTTFYILICYVLTVGFSFIFDYPITQITDIETTLFLAAASLFPEMEVRLFFLLPVKMKWLAVLSGGFVLLRFFQLDWVGKGYLLAIYANYLLFFGPMLLDHIKHAIRRWNYRRKLK